MSSSELEHTQRVGGQFPSECNGYVNEIIDLCVHIMKYAARVHCVQVSARCRRRHTQKDRIKAVGH